MMGCDRSVGLAGICRQHGHDVAVCDAVLLPFRFLLFFFFCGGVEKATAAVC
jgi:hypothetical protein